MGSSVRLAVLTLLNSYEFMAAGLRGGAFDEEIYQRMYSTNAQRDWEFPFPFIQTIQEQQGPTVYADCLSGFESLVKMWKERPLRRHR
jgi:hypothetical protein